MPNLSNISDYMEVLLQSEFLQFNLLSAKDFSKFLQDRGISLSLKELEYYDKKDILRPALRLRLPTIDDHPSQKYANVSTNSFSIRYCYTQGFVEFPKGGDFQPWESYTNGHEERVRQLYHMYQFVPIRQLIMGNNTVLSPQFFEEVKDLQRSLGSYKERITKIMNITQTSSKEWVPKVGLLMLLQEAYGFGYYGTLMVDPQLGSKFFYEKWRTWRFNEFCPNHIRETSGMGLEEIKQWYKDLCYLGEAIDPISNWFVLLQLIQRSKKARLKKEALLAQEYYRLARMVGAFIYDLTREIMPDPDDLMDEGKGTWKSEIYGQSFNYNNKQTRLKIIDNYFIDRQLSIALIYEGLTEDTVINKIFDVLSVDGDTEGIFSWNATGQGNIKENLNAFAKLARANEMEVFLILDRDGDWLDILNDFKKRGYIREGTYHVWKKDFESDNFSIDEVVEKVNYLSGQKLLNKIEKSDVIDRMNNNSGLVMMKAISDSFWEKNQVRLKEVVSKNELGKLLIEPRIAEIELEIKEDRWKPLLPIEKVLERIFLRNSRFIG